MLLAFSSLLCVMSLLFSPLTSCLLQPDTSWLSQMSLTPPACRPNQTQPLPPHFYCRKEQIDIEKEAHFGYFVYLQNLITEQICQIKWQILIFYEFITLPSLILNIGYDEHPLKLQSYIFFSNIPSASGTTQDHF